MKLKILLPLLFFTYTTLFATNGTLLIGHGVKSRGMGGTGIAFFTGTDSALKNPALITYQQGAQFDVALTFMNNGEELTSNEVPYAQYGGTTSPLLSLGYVEAFSKDFVFAVHSASTVEYENHLSGYDTTSHAVRDTAFAYAVKDERFSYGISVILTESNFDHQDYMFSYGGYDPVWTFTYQVGMAYRADDAVFGATYKNQKTFDHQTWDFNGTIQFLNASIPAELGIGASFERGDKKFAFDIKKIFWEDATDGSALYPLRDQLVIAVGLEHKVKYDLYFRYGVNLSNTIANESLAPQSYIYAPVENKRHYTFGLTWDVTDFFDLEMAAVYAEGAENHTATMNLPMGTLTNVTVASGQFALTVGASFNYE